MKKWLALLTVLLLMPVTALARQVHQPQIRFCYNGQTYECTYSYFEKCCSEADTSYELWLRPVNCEALESVSISFPMSATAGDRYSLRQGEAEEWVTFYTTGAQQMQHYVSMPGSLFGTGLIAETDFYDLTIHSMEYVHGIPYVNASVRAAFMGGEVSFEIDFDVRL